MVEDHVSATEIAGGPGIALVIILLVGLVCKHFLGILPYSAWLFVVGGATVRGCCLS